MQHEPAEPLQRGADSIVIPVQFTIPGPGPMVDDEDDGPPIAGTLPANGWPS